MKTDHKIRGVAAFGGKPAGSPVSRPRLCRGTLFILAMLPALVWSAPGQDDASPFHVQPNIITNSSAAYLSALVRVPKQHHIYADRISCELDGVPLSISLPRGSLVYDRFSKSERRVFDSDFEMRCELPDVHADDRALSLTFQGCSEHECYFPETRDWLLNPDYGLTRAADSTPAAPEALGSSLINGFRLASRGSGYMDSEAFLQFLERAHTPGSDSDDAMLDFGRVGLWAGVGIILAGGLALNLTPCVLPMVPINLAILGVGAGSRNRRRGWLIGLAYGGGMAAAYGALGLGVVLTGSRFGALNASPWFNWIIAIVFAVLGLAMFDKVAIDLSRFQSSSNSARTSSGVFIAAGTMGAIAALLAGACVAPVVISVLLLATTFYQGGNGWGLALPFLLGLGMAIPWPFAGAGFSFLPKPGAWMTRIKHGFGVVIFGFALWYGWMGWTLSGLGNSGPLMVAAKGDTVRALRSALDESRASGRPVLLDFWASWCKSCQAMEHTTFRDAAVRGRLEQEFIFVKVQAERLSDPALKPVLDEFGVLGLPTYVVLTPDDQRAGR